jgi:hypothetical protein
MQRVQYRNGGVSEPPRTEALALKANRPRGATVRNPLAVWAPNLEVHLTNTKVIAVATLIGAVTLPGAFLARLIVERLPIHVHTAMLNTVVVVGGAVMIAGAVGRMG